MPAAAMVWSASLHQTFRLLSQPSQSLRIFLQSEGQSAAQILSALPFESARSSSGGTSPDAKRYRDSKAVYQAVGLVFEENGVLRVTELGRATLRWIDDIAISNVAVLGRHAAYALASCQLRNPTGSGAGYAPDVRVFPFQFIWKAMLALDGRISSEELNCAIFYVTNESELATAVAMIKAHRRDPQTRLLAGVVSGARTNDRIVPWMSLASFGYSLIADKRETSSDFYEIRPEARAILREASQIRRAHKEYSSVSDYVQQISQAAALPKDIR